MSSDTTLSKITTNITDGKHGDCVNEEGSGYYFLSVKDIKEFGIDYRNARQITESDFIETHKRTRLEKGDILLANSGHTIGKMFYVKESPYLDKSTFQKSVAIIKPDSSKINGSYLYYNLLANVEGLRRAAVGSAQPNLLLRDLRDFKISVDELSHQNSISKLLSSLDSKIELNNKINAELEAMAKLIYDYWFVQFDFPDANGKPYKTSGGKMVYNETLKREIPDGWGVKPLSKFLDVITGKKDANYAAENGQYHFFTCGDKALRCDEYEFEGKSILLAGNGNFNVKRYEGRFNAYQRTYVLIPNNPNHYSLVFYAVNNRVKQLTSGSRGSIVKFITKGDIEEILVCLSEKDEYFYQILDDVFDKMHTAYIENLKLEELRDWLLPMLMNGQVTVNNSQ